MLEQIIKMIESKRLEYGMSKRHLCNKAGISVSQYFNLINNMDTKVSTIENLLKALGFKKINIKIDEV